MIANRSLGQRLALLPILLLPALVPLMNMGARRLFESWPTARAATLDTLILLAAAMLIAAVAAGVHAWRHHA